MTRLALLAAFLAAVAACAACGGKSAPSGDDPAPGCREVAAKLVELAERDNRAAADAPLSAGALDELERQCTEQAWSPERRRCFLTAADQDATLSCPER